MRIVLLALLLVTSQLMIAHNNCYGKFLNPIDDICWTCLFPLSIGSNTVAKSPEKLPDTKNPKTAFCSCGKPIARPGIAVGFWEINNMVEVTRTPFCLPSLGGAQLVNDSYYPHGTIAHDISSAKHATYHVHWYVYPVLSLLNIISDVACVDKPDFDVAWLTELDPLWLDDEWSFLLAPESVLFSKIETQLACSVEASNMTRPTQKPTDNLFWCLGEQGSTYPLTGHIKAHTGGVRSSLTLAERMTYRMHRIGALQVSMVDPKNPQSICHKQYKYVMPKSHYRYQMSYPVAQSVAPDGCKPFGATTLNWQAGREIPIKGEDYSYLIWRKVNCCA